MQTLSWLHWGFNRQSCTLAARLQAAPRASSLSELTARRVVWCGKGAAARDYIWRVRMCDRSPFLGILQREASSSRWSARSLRPSTFQFSGQSSSCTSSCCSASPWRGRLRCGRSRTSNARANAVLQSYVGTDVQPIALWCRAKADSEREVICTVLLLFSYFLWRVSLSLSLSLPSIWSSTDTCRSHMGKGLTEARRTLGKLLLVKQFSIWNCKKS